MVTCNAVISACKKGQELRRTFDVFAAMWRKALVSWNSACETGKVQLRGLLPNLITHNAAISACEKGETPHQARIGCSSYSPEASCST